MLNNNYENNSSNSNSLELAKLRRIITIQLSAAAILALVLVTLGITRLVNSARSDSNINTPVLATVVSDTAIYTEPEIYHTEQLAASELADSYWRPLPELKEDEVKTPEHFEVKALYIGSGSALDKAIELCNNSELNCIVIDLKNEYGLPYMSQVPTAKEIGYVWDAYDLAAVVEKCHSNNIRVIGRIVSFNDQVAAQHFPERAIQDADGNVVQFSNEGNKPFLSPYNTENWDYLIAIGVEAAEHGVDEIQFDYVRFPAGPTKNKVKPKRRQPP
jgi:hypothetical protein